MNTFKIKQDDRKRKEKKYGLHNNNNNNTCLLPLTSDPNYMTNTR